MKNLTPYQEEILSYISDGKIQEFLNSKVGDKKERLKYYKNINDLKEKQIVIEFHGFLTINTDSKYYKFQGYDKR